MSLDRERVIIIGASLAGTIAAITLARAGVPVVVIDKDRFPRRKPCGEGLSARGRKELEAVGCSLETLGCRYAQLSGYRILKGEKLLELPERAGLVGVARSELDHRLVEYAGRLSLIDFVLGCKATVRELDTARCRVRVGERDVEGGALIIADGAQSSTLRALGRGSPAPRNPRLGTSSGWRITGGTLQSKVHTILVPDGEIYLTPLIDGRVNVSALGSQTVVRAFSHTASLLPRIDAVGALFRVSLELEHPPLSCGSISTLYRGAQFHGAFVVGDACETFDPCAGFGMTHALLSGRLAAQSIIEGRGLTDHSTALARYEREREARVRDVRGFTRLTSLTMGHGLGRKSLPLLVGTGLAALVSEAVHSARGPAMVRRAVSLFGASRGGGD